MKGTGAWSHLVPNSTKSLDSTLLSITDFCLTEPPFQVLPKFLAMTLRM